MGIIWFIGALKNATEKCRDSKIIEAKMPMWERQLVCLPWSESNL
jgi:hypothetical protein